MIPLSTLLATIDVADREYWLGRCEGFDVRSDGRRLGVVEFVRYGSDPSLPHTIHLSTGIMRVRQIAIPAADVEGVDPRGQTIWVRARRSPRAWQWRRVAAWLRDAYGDRPARLSTGRRRTGTRPAACRRPA
jgi:hypothetical protein